MLNELSGCEVTALCEPSIENIIRQPKAFLPPLVTADYETFLSSGIDAVVIATPARTHYQLVMQALEHDKHVLVEKPFATNTEDALAMINAAQQRGLSLLVGHTYVYHPAVEYLRELIESGELGKLRYIHTARLNFGILQPDVDVLWDLAPHDISILLYLLQKEPEIIGGQGTACINPRLFEVAHVDLRFPDGPFAHIYVSWLEPSKIRRLTFVGEEKTAVYDDVAQGEMIRIYDKSIKLTTSNGTENIVAPQYLQKDITIPYIGDGEPLKNQCTRFLSSIRTGSPVPSDGWEGLKVVRVLESAERALYGKEAEPAVTMLPSHHGGRVPEIVLPREPRP